MDSTVLSQPSRLRLSRFHHNVNEFSMPGPSIASSRFSETNSDAPRPSQNKEEEEETPANRLRNLLRRMPQSPSSTPKPQPKRQPPSEPDVDMNESDFERVSVSLAAQPSMAQESLKELFSKFRDTTPRKPIARRRNSIDTSDFESPAKPKSKSWGKQKSASDDELLHTDEDPDGSVSSATSRATVFNNLREQLNRSHDSTSLMLPPVASSTPHKPALAQSTSHFQFGASRSNLLANHSSMAFALKDMSTLAEHTREDQPRRSTTPQFDSSADEITDHLLSEENQDDDGVEESPQKRHQRSANLSHPKPTHPSSHYETSIDEISHHLLDDTPEAEPEPVGPQDPPEQHESSVDEISTHLLNNLEPEEEPASPEAPRRRRVSFGKVQSRYDTSMDEISEHLLSDAEEDEGPQGYMQTPKSSSSRRTSAVKPRMSSILRRESTSSMATPIARRPQSDRLSATPATIRRWSPSRTPSPVPRPASSTPVSASRNSFTPETPAVSATPARPSRLSSSAGLTPRPPPSPQSSEQETPITVKPIRPQQNGTSPGSISSRGQSHGEPDPGTLSEEVDQSLNMDLENMSFLNQNASEEDTRSRPLAQNTQQSMSLTGVFGGPIDSSARETTRMDFTEIRNWHRSSSFEQSEENIPPPEEPVEERMLPEPDPIPQTTDDEPSETPTTSPTTSRFSHRRAHTRGSSLLKELQQANGSESDQPSGVRQEPVDAPMPSFDMSEETPHPTIHLPEPESDHTPEQMDQFHFPNTPAPSAMPFNSTLKTPAPPGAFLATPYYPRTIHQTPGLRTTGSLSMMKTPAPPGAYMDTPRASSMPTPSYLGHEPERTYSALKTPRPPGAWAGTPAPLAWKAKSSRLGNTVRFDDSEETTITGRALIPKVEGTDHVDFSEATTSTPPTASSSNPTFRGSMSTSRIHYVDSMGREVKQEVDEGFSEAEEETETETEMEEDIWVPPRDHKDATERLKAGLAELKTELGGLEGEIKLNSRMETKDIHHWKALAEASMISRHNREELEAQLIEAQKRTDKAMAKSRRWFNVNMPMFWIFTLMQIVVLYFIYRMSSSHTRFLFLTKYYDPYYANLHLHIFRSSSHSHPLTRSILSIYDIFVAGYWHAALLELRAHLGAFLDTLLGAMGLHKGEPLMLQWPPT